MVYTWLPLAAKSHGLGLDTSSNLEIVCYALSRRNKRSNNFIKVLAAQRATLGKSSPSVHVLRSSEQYPLPTYTELSKVSLRIGCPTRPGLRNIHSSREARGSAYDSNTTSSAQELNPEYSQ